MVKISLVNGKENMMSSPFEGPHEFQDPSHNPDQSSSLGQQTQVPGARGDGSPFSDKARSMFVRNIALDLILTFVTFFLYNIYVNAEQMDALNYMLGEPKYSFWRWFFFCILTFGMYHVYHEYVVARDLMTLTGEPQSMEPAIHVVLTCLGFPFVADAIQQYHINSYFGSKRL